MKGRKWGGLWLPEGFGGMVEGVILGEKSRQEEVKGKRC